MFGAAYALVIFMDTASPRCQGSTPALRSATRDAENAAWLLAAMCGHAQDAQAVPLPPNESRQPTFDQIAMLSDSMGVATDLRRLTYSELCSLSVPCVTLLRHGPQATGYFAIALNAKPGQVTTINAGWMTVAVYSEDEFRLRWTGHALVPRCSRPSSYALNVPLFLVGAIISSVLVPRLRKSRQVTRPP